MGKCTALQERYYLWCVNIFFFLNLSGWTTYSMGFCRNIYETLIAMFLGFFTISYHLSRRTTFKNLVQKGSQSWPEASCQERELVVLQKCNLFPPYHFSSLYLTQSIWLGRGRKESVFFSHENLKFFFRGKEKLFLITSIWLLTENLS